MALDCGKLSVVNGTVLESESILPNKNSRCLYAADGAYCGITTESLVKAYPI